MIAIINGTVAAMTGRSPAPGTVLIKDGKILAAGPGVDVPAEAEVIDARGGWIMPGLVEAHCHVGIMEEIYRVEGNDGNETTDPITPHLRALDAINPMDEGFRDALQGGVTTMFVPPGSANVVGGTGPVLKTCGRIVDDMCLRQPAGLKVAFGENPKRVYGDQKKAPSTRMATAALLREYLSRALEYQAKMERAGGDPEKIPARDFKLEAALPVLRGEMPLRAHAHRADDIMTAIRIAHEFGVKIVIEHCTEGHLVVDELAGGGIPCVVGPSFSSRAKVELKERTFATPGILARAGVLVAIMTDHPVVPIKYLNLCAALAVREGMAEEDALRAITINAAAILGVDHRVGSLAPGKDGDVVVWDGHPLDVRSRVTTVMMDGRVVYRR